MRDHTVDHYAVLGVDPAATPEAITAAFRAAARRVHPDVPSTGDADAFMQVHDAYEVLGDTRRRAAYDAARRQDMEEDEGEGEGVSDAPPHHDGFEIPAAEWPRPAGPAFGLWVGGVAAALLALALGLGGLGRGRPAPLASQTMPANADPAPQALPEPVRLAPPAGGLPAAEAPNSGYVLPGANPATLWRRGPGEGRYTPVGEIAAFAPVSIRRIVAEDGMTEVRAPDGREGFVYASRVAPGDAVAAERARCIDAAGPPPTNNEILAHRGDGPAQLLVQNQRDQPAVLKLRDLAGTAVVSVFIAPHEQAALDHLPAGVFRPEFAFGELWSHGCARFVAGMRAQQFAGPDRLDAAGKRYAIPPADAIDEADDAFNRE